HPSARLGIYKYPVFDMDNTMQTLPTKGVQPVFVVIYRRQESCRFLQCDPHMAQLLAQLQNNSCLQTGFAFLRGLYGQVDESNLLLQLQRLQQRGIVKVQKNSLS
ncbi:MAG: hypothetical protein AAF320_06590, partial [Myxococcota bacterium]